AAGDIIAGILPLSGAISILVARVSYAVGVVKLLMLAMCIKLRHDKRKLLWHAMGVDPNHSARSFQ
ncbi:MAG TPA: hypothetical protein VGD41_16760, partial [Pyrinomonadaceae bacterium]